MKLEVPGHKFRWLNEPDAVVSTNTSLSFETRENTDFWQRTHYGFRRDDGHFLYTLSRTDFRFAATFRFEGEVQYDQCGIMVRVDAENWIKCAIEYENEDLSRLGSVVTNLGYSDWATADINSEIDLIHYAIHRHGDDFLIEHSFDGTHYNQMRIAHLHHCPEELMVGVYACSPKRAGFRCTTEGIAITQSTWCPES